MCTAFKVANSIISVIDKIQHEHNTTMNYAYNIYIFALTVLICRMPTRSPC